MLKKILLLITIIGIICITVALTKDTVKTSDQKIIYRYIPRTFEEEQAEPVYVSDIFSTMFNGDLLWSESVGQIEQRKNQEINKFFISQV
jgi:hypothetical protein